MFPAARRYRARDRVAGLRGTDDGGVAKATISRNPLIVKFKAERQFREQCYEFEKGGFWF